MKNILITGGAGYIGTSLTKELCNQGNAVTVIDNLSNSTKDHIDKRSFFHKIDLTDKKETSTFLSKKKFDHCIHLASYKSVNESNIDTAKYSKNITMTINLLDALNKNCLKNFIFASSAAVYGQSQKNIILESQPTIPINFYGETKLINEKLINWYSKAYNFNSIILRYFNVAGKSDINYYEDKPENLLPIIQKKVESKSTIDVFGGNYTTKDGTCIRDYIHINDVVIANIKSINLNKSTTLNIGSSIGYSVLDIIKEFSKQLGFKLNYKFTNARSGDSPIIVSNNNLAKKELQWEAKLSLQEIVRSIINKS